LGDKYYHLEDEYKHLDDECQNLEDECKNLEDEPSVPRMNDNTWNMNVAT